MRAGFWSAFSLEIEGSEMEVLGDVSDRREKGGWEDV